MPAPLREVRLITVSPSSTKARLCLGPVAPPCAIGRGGIRMLKREGDGATPIGLWPMRFLLYRPDRVPLPVTGLEAWAIAPDDGWCDDPRDRRYNRPVRLPYPASAEAMWREDHLYDLVIVLGYNDEPVVPGKGSAIFMHLARPGYAPTEGCIALRRDHMLSLLSRCGPETAVRVG
ncbi:L,D-transpeptidase family protein [Rhodoligotrophos defluvii]|uniref:L,D-transpeptidase family protein n=1 Tax=Rhodoligotrophos defluvii TaxID=2561934 RepID=UPI0010C9A0F3|nr:L,D-transpeptidase family protein [Rhodoligotrophos defluvii]